MTLLESVIATVLLAVVAVACLEGTRGAMRLEAQSQAFAAAALRAEGALERARLGAAGAADAQVSRQPYVVAGAATGLDLVTVEVRSDDGRLLRMARLVEQPSGARP